MQALLYQNLRYRQISSTEQRVLFSKLILFVLGYPSTMEKFRVSNTVLNKRKPPDYNDFRHKNTYALERLHSKVDSKSADEQDCVGFAYDHGEYPIIVAVHSNVKQASSSPIDSSLHPGGSQIDSYHRGNEESRFEDRTLYKSQGLRQSVDPQCSVNYNSSRFQKDLDSHRFSVNTYPRPVSVQNERLGGGAYFTDRRIPQRPMHLNNLRPPFNSPDNFHFQPNRHNGYVLNGFQAPPVFGVHPAMLVPGMSDIRRAHLANLGVHLLPPQASQLELVYGPSPSSYAKSMLRTRISSKHSGHVDGSSLKHQEGLVNTDGSRKRTYDQVDYDGVTDGHLVPPESVRLPPTPKYAFNTMDVLSYINGEQPRTRAPYFDSRISCSDLVDAAVLSARRYADVNGRLVNHRTHEKERFIIENVEDPVTRQKTELNVPCEWMNKGFFEFILRHENRYELLQILKVAASSSRELLLYVIDRLLSKRVNENASIILDNLKRSDLPDIVKEKVLSVIEELIWGRSPRRDLWLKRALENKRSSSNEVDTVVTLSVEDESLGCSDSDHTTSQNREDTIRQENNFLHSSESTLQKVDTSGMSGQGAVVDESTEQNSEKTFRDKDRTGVNESKQLEVQTSSSLSSVQSKVIGEVELCQSSSHIESSYSSPICQKDACSSNEICKSPTASCEIEQNCDPEESTDGRISYEKAPQDDKILNSFQTRDQCTQVENLQGFSGKEESFSDSEERLIDTNGNSLDEDSLCHYYSIEEVTGLENTDFELLANVSVTVDSHGNTIIRKEIADGDSLDDGVLFDSLKIMG